jgi:hypothetical protein
MIPCREVISNVSHSESGRAFGSSSPSFKSNLQYRAVRHCGYMREVSTNTYTRKEQGLPRESHRLFEIQKLLENKHCTGT